MQSLIITTIICFLLLVLWHKHCQSLDPKYLAKRYHFALWYQERLAKYTESKSNADLAYCVAMENAKKEYKDSRFNPKRLVTSPPAHTK